MGRIYICELDRRDVTKSNCRACLRREPDEEFGRYCRHLDEMEQATLMDV